LPAWIRGFVDSDKTGVESRPSTATGATIDVAEARATAATAPLQVESVARSSEATAETGSDRDQSAEPSDLTETRFVLLAGATLVIILAVLASFYL